MNEREKNLENTRSKAIAMLNGSVKDIELHFKAERIAAALFIATNHMTVEELQGQIRDNALLLVSGVLEYVRKPVSDRFNMHGLFARVTGELLSLLSIAYLSKVISDKNYDLLVGEIGKLVEQFLPGLGTLVGSKDEVLSGEFFTRIKDVDIDSETPALKDKLDKGQDIPKLNAKGNNKENYATDSSRTNTHGPKSGRREAIIKLLKQRSNLTVKDFLEVIVDCSEKTIQRELFELARLGVLKKEGERRWTRYSLNQ